MELVRKIGLWIVAAIVVVGAGVVYFAVVSKIGAEVDKEFEGLEARSEKLGAWSRKSDQIPNPEWIKEAKVWAERVNNELDNCALFLAVQPLGSYRRLFYRDERVGVDKLLFHEINRDLGKYEWTQAYAEHCATLQRKIDERPGSAFRLKTESWPTIPPTDEEMTQAMELFWVQKELADRLSDLVERDLDELLAPNREVGVFPANVSDIVITRGETKLDEPLRLLDQAELVQVAEAILLNDEEIDLATVFDKTDFPWDRVYSLTTNEEQRRFLDGLVGDPKDYFNRQRFVDYVMELRSVRYRTDVADLLEREGGEFAKVGAQLRNMTENDRIVLRALMQEWNRTRLAQTIAAVVTIRNEEDYRIIRDNHDPWAAGLTDLRIDRPGGSLRGPGGDSRDPLAGGGLPSYGGRGRDSLSGTEAATTVQSENYRAWPVRMRIRIEFERIPVLMRRLLTSSMRFRFSIKDIVPETRTDSERMRAGTGLPNYGYEPPAPLRGAGRIFPAAPAPRAVPRRAVPFAAGKAAEGELEVLRNYVGVLLEGEGYQFTPLRAKFQDRLDDKPREMPSPTPAPGPGAGRPKTPEGNG